MTQALALTPAPALALASPLWLTFTGSVVDGGDNSCKAGCSVDAVASAAVAVASAAIAASVIPWLSLQSAPAKTPTRTSSGTSLSLALPLSSLPLSSLALLASLTFVLALLVQGIALAVFQVLIAIILGYVVVLNVLPAFLAVNPLRISHLPASNYLGKDID